MGVTAGRARPHAKSLVYQATNAINGKRYIGVTMYSLADRRAKHFWSALRGKSTMPFARAIRKYGKDAFKFEVLEWFESYDDALAGEARLVATLNPEYNVGAAGFGNAGWHHTEEEKERIRARNKGQPGYWKGKRLPEHVRQLFVEKAAKPEQRAKWAEWMKLGPQAEARSVICLNDGMQFTSIREAARAYGLDEKGVGGVCRGRNRTVGGYSFQYTDGSTPPLPAPRKGKLTRAQVGIIKLMADYGASITQMAWVYDTSYVTVNRILLGHTWSEVPKGLNNVSPQ